MSEYDSGWLAVQSGTTTTNHTSPASSYISSVSCRFKGKSYYYWSDDSGEYSESFGVVSINGTKTCGIDNFCAATAFVSGDIDYTIYPVLGESDPTTITVTLYDSNGTSVLDTDIYTNITSGYSGSFSMAATYIGTTKYVGFTKNTGELWSAVVSADAVYGEQFEIKTSTPTAMCNGTSVTYSGTLDNGVSTSWLTCPATFITDDGVANAITYAIQGSLESYFELKYTYTITVPVSEWTVYGETDDYTSYEVFSGGYATTLMSGTWPTVSGLVFGDGSIILEFATTVGTTVPATTWTVNQDIFWFDIDYDDDKIGTVIQSRGTKLAGGTMYSLISDWATALTLAATVDTFLIRDVEAGATMVYTMTVVPTADTDVFIISPNTSRKETITILSAGKNATGYWYGIDGTTTYAHGIFEEMLGADDAKWYFTGAAADVTGWYSTMVTQYGAPDGGTKELDPRWPVKVGSEVIYMYRMSASDSTSLTFKSATDPYRGEYGVGYAHAIGATAFCVPTVGEYAKSNTMYNTYGPAEVYTSPLGIVDGHTLDLLAYNGLMNSTTAATTAVGKMPGHMLPATIGLGDWVNISYEE